MEKTHSQCRFVWRALLLLSAVLRLTGHLDKAPAAETDADLVQQVLGDWEARKTYMRTVAYTLIGTKMTPRGAYPYILTRSLEDVPATDIIRDFRRVWNIDFERGLIQKDQKDTVFHLATRAWVPQHKCTTFDGDVLTVLPKAGAGRSDSSKGESEQYIQLWTNQAAMKELRAVSDLPIFFACGYPYIGDTLRTTEATSLEPNTISVYQRVVNGTSCERLVLHIPDARGTAESRMYAYTVDLARQSAVLSASSYHAGRCEYQIDIDHQQMPDGWWVPERWIAHAFRGESFLTTERVKVDNVRLNPGFDRAVFTVELTAGTTVEKDGELCQVIADGRSFRPIARARLADAIIGRTRSIVALCILAALTAGAAVVGYKTPRFSYAINLRAALPGRKKGKTSSRDVTGE